MSDYDYFDDYDDYYADWGATAERAAYDAHLLGEYERDMAEAEVQHYRTAELTSKAHAWMTRKEPAP